MSDIDLGDPKAAEALFTGGDGTASVLEVVQQLADTTPSGPQADSTNRSEGEPQGLDAQELIDQATAALTGEPAPVPTQAKAPKVAAPAEDDAIDLDAALGGDETQTELNPAELQRALFHQVQQNSAVLGLLQRGQQPAQAQQPQGVDWNAIATDPDTQTQFMSRIPGLNPADGQSRFMVEQYARGKMLEQEVAELRASQQQQAQQQQYRSIQAQATPRVKATLAKIAEVPEATANAIADQVSNAMLHGYGFEDAFKAAVSPMVPVLQQLRTLQKNAPQKQARSEQQAQRQQRAAAGRPALRAVATQGQSGGRTLDVKKFAKDFDPKNIGALEDKFFVG